ncbi:PGF-CTERM sorting domain-containing protein [Halorussus salilacus]|uniref:PGF-CTERM sorting domain-containing protein n=1 Tax=Halorussus salilacus TaxID=2953750 RepID=UPI00209CDEF9|nr:PGF-CTERM sorting domain-containing protein [Halorussus salilacus]USZ68568.1 PGF-CTERM sorting domain-containing protein [Halorussus salilacus]
MERGFKSSVLVLAVVGMLLVGAIPFGVGIATADDEWPDDEEDAAEVGPGTHEGSIDSSDDTDYIKMPVEKGDTVTATLEKAQGDDVIGSIYWPGGATSLEGEAKTEDTEKATVDEDGYFYVELHSESDEDFPEDWSVTLDRNEGADEWPNHEENAIEVGPGTHEGSVNSWDDTDYMRMPVDEDDTVTATLEKAQGHDITGSIYWPGGATSLSGEDKSEDTEKATIEEEGYFYVELESDSVETESEDWSVTLDRTKDVDEWPDKEEDATEVGTGTHSGAISSWDDTDYMRLPVQKGDTVTTALEKAQGHDIVGNIYWPGGATTLSGESQERITESATADETGFLYVELESDSVGTESEDWSISFTEGAPTTTTTETTTTETTTATTTTETTTTETTTTATTTATTTTETTTETTTTATTTATTTTATTTATTTTETTTATETTEEAQTKTSATSSPDTETATSEPDTETATSEPDTETNPTETTAFDETAEADDSNEASQPGFTGSAALVAVIVALALARRRGGAGR